ncbi:MAG TPA: hypothetical protein PKE55_09090 [Kiritimatiellia bacterium]|nr:hypothetical protein [Kiritimatiellia bacterium]
MAAKRQRENSVSLDSFLDILTCLQGVLMLIIITTGIDAAQTKVLVRTPLQLAGDYRSIYIECRGDRLFLIQPEQIAAAVQRRQEEIAAQTRSGQIGGFLQALGDSNITVGDYIVDLRYMMVNQIAILPNPEGSGGYNMGDPATETSQGFFGSILARMDKENEKIHFFVRDDSFEVFKRARIKAWTDQAKVTYDLVGRNEPIRLDLTF